MQAPLQINFHEVPQSEALEIRIREKAARLDSFYPRIMSCRVTVEAQDRHKHQGKQYAVRLDVRVPGKEIVASRDHHEDVYVALREAFDAARRQLEEYAHVQRGEVKTHETPPAVPREGA
jgi:ribosomal subunit interface protein